MVRRFLKRIDKHFISSLIYFISTNYVCVRLLYFISWTCIDQMLCLFNNLNNDFKQLIFVENIFYNIVRNSEDMQKWKFELVVVYSSP